MILEKSIFCVGMNYCRLATLVGTKTCAEVWRYVTKHSLKAPTHSSVDIEAWRYVEKKKKAKKKKRSSHIHRTQHQFERQQPRSFVPCDHDGECNPETCPCAGDMSYCEKFCACAASCLNRYTGCKCKGCKCRTRACPCYAAHRECDPDLCGSCEAHIPNELVDGAYNEEGKSGKKHRICQNIGLQTKKTKHILLGPSNVHGWGAFAKETTERNALLTEYLGEIISQEEADRRGKIYDKANCSYLFDLNEAYVIDAARKGNKIKFANHSEAPNCFSRIMFVNGDHRIGIYAKVKVKAGDELFFDYQHDHVGQTPEWFGQFKQAKTTHKKR